MTTDRYDKWTAMRDAEPIVLTEADLLRCFEQARHAEDEYRKARAERIESMSAWWKQLTYAQRANPYVQLAYQAAIEGTAVSPGIYRKITEALR